MDVAPDHFSLLRTKLAALPAAGSPDQRRIVWVDKARVIGVARNPDRRIELFLTGPPLIASSPLIVSHLSHDRWSRSDGEPIEANRLVLPPAPHFDAVGAFLCAELIENSALDDLPTGFARSEPIIEMAMQRLGLRSEELVGLSGELLLLDALLSQPGSDPAKIIDCWHGHRRSNRDLQIGLAGIEVKATRGSTSRHRIQGLHQIEIGHGVDGAREHHLLLVSIGIEDGDIDTDHDAWTLARLIQRITHRIARAEDGDTVKLGFVAKVAAYGLLDSADGDLLASPAAHQPFAVAFARSYDLTDPAIRVLRSTDAAVFPHVVAESLTFTVDLPDKVRGDLNPIVGLPAIATDILRRATTTAPELEVDDDAP